MPVYEYECPHCTSIKEIISNKTDNKKILCDVCKLCYMEKIISKSSFILKDGKSGWGKDGYKDK